MKEYLFKPITREMVARHLARHHEPFTSAESMQGGSGRTSPAFAAVSVPGTIAANLAWHLGKRANRHTVLVDGDLYRGSCAILLNAKSGAGCERPSRHRNASMSCPSSAQSPAVTDRLHVLSGEENLLDKSSTKPAPPAERLIETLRRRYNFVVIDAPFTGTGLHRDLLMLGTSANPRARADTGGGARYAAPARLPNGPLQACIAG